MNRERAKELLPIIEAFANGEEIEVMPDGDIEWMAVTGSPCWPDAAKYRSKPKAREFWANTKSRVIMPIETIHDRVPGNSKDIIKVREVL